MLYDPQRLSQLVKCFSFCKAQVAQCVPVQGMSFKGTDNERSGKSFTGSCCLSKEKVSTISLRQSSQFIFLTMIHLPVLTGSQMPKIQHPSDNDQRAYFEYPAQSCYFIVPARVPVKRSTEYAFRNQHFRGYPVAPQLCVVLLAIRDRNIGEGGGTKPDMRQLMGKRKHLGRFAVGSIYKDKWCDRVRQ